MIVIIIVIIMIVMFICIMVCVIILGLQDHAILLLITIKYY